MAALAAWEPFKDVHLRRELPDGRIIWIRSSGAPIFTEAVEFKGYFGTSTEVTDQVAARQEAQSASGRLAEAIGGAGNPVALYDADDRLVTCNDAYRDLRPAFAEILAPGILFAKVAATFADAGAGAKAAPGPGQDKAVDAAITGGIGKYRARCHQGFGVQGIQLVGTVQGNDAYGALIAAFNYGHGLQPLSERGWRAAACTSDNFRKSLAEDKCFVAPSRRMACRNASR